MMMRLFLVAGIISALTSTASQAGPFIGLSLGYEWHRLANAGTIDGPTANAEVGIYAPEVGGIISSLSLRYSPNLVNDAMLSSGNQIGVFGAVGFEIRPYHRPYLRAGWVHSTLTIGAKRPVEGPALGFGYVWQNDPQIEYYGEANWIDLAYRGGDHAVRVHQFQFGTRYRF